MLGFLCIGLGDAQAGASGERAAEAETGAPPPPTVVEITTSMGTITLQLEPDRAPLTVANFLKYVASGHYEGTVFHRVVGGYVIQGGGFAKEGDRLVEKPTGEPIRSEADNGLKNSEGTIAMARTDASDTATAQFFINCRDNEMLDQSNAAAGYAVFGRVTKGLDVIMQINGVPTGVREVQGRLGSGQLRPMPLKGVPLSDVIIESVRVVEAAAAGPAGKTAEDPTGKTAEGSGGLKAP
jgi:cyclophilin family peptidyl-prolyl cis-trans isomerase